MPSVDDRTESQRLVYQAVRLMLEPSELSEIEECLMKAIDLWADNLEALEEAAHFFDAVMSDPVRATRFAELCREKAAKLTADMDEILKDNANPR
jgi:hypothetical protein